MPTYYVGPGGNNANAGTSWALRKLTLNGAEDIPVQAGDTVYVGPGTYRETLTCDVSGSAGSPVTYIGDYSGALTDGVGGVVRITGSDNDQTRTRSLCVSANGKNYRTFRGFLMDGTTAQTIYAINGPTNWIIDDCNIQGHGANFPLWFDGNLSAITVSNCAVFGWLGGCVNFNDGSTTRDNTACVIENCVLISTHNASCVQASRIGGVTVRNSLMMMARYGVVATNLAAAQTVTVNNCIIAGCNVGLIAGAAGMITEDYNALFNATDRSNVATGANSVAYIPLLDTRWFFEAVNGGDMVTPFDLASYSQLVNVAGTSPTTTDLRGTSVIGAQREFGPLEYDPALLIEAGSGGGGAVSISPYRGNF